MNTTVTQDEAIKIAGGLFPKIARVIQAAFQHFVDIKKQKTAVIPNLLFEPRTAYGNVHDFIKAGIRNEFGNEPNVRIAEPNGIFVMIVEEKIVLRFKKMNKDFQTSNVQTAQTDDYNNQDLQSLFPGQLTFLHVGYLPDLTCTYVENIYLFCRSGKNIEWHHSLKGSMRQLSIEMEAQVLQVEATEPRVSIKKSLNHSLKTGTDDEPGV